MTRSDLRSATLRSGRSRAAGRSARSPTCSCLRASRTRRGSLDRPEESPALAPHSGKDHLTQAWLEAAVAGCGQPRRAPIQAFNAGLLQARSFEPELTSLRQPTLVLAGRRTPIAAGIGRGDAAGSPCFLLASPATGATSGSGRSTRQASGRAGWRRFVVPTYCLGRRPPRRARRSRSFARIRD